MAVYVPPANWILVDGAVAIDATNGRLVSQSMALLDHLGADADLLILTHPHDDHAVGFWHLVSRYPHAAIGIAELDLPPVDRLSGGPEIDPASDDNEAITQPVAQALTEIKAALREAPKRRWQIRRSDIRQVGDATVRVLHPTDAAINWAHREHARQRRQSPETPEYRLPRPWANKISAACIVEWVTPHGEARLLLGADVTKQDWRAMSVVFPHLGKHHVLKFPHHGSIGACHNSFGHGTRERTWVVTPYTPSRLPRSDQRGGLEWMRARVDSIYVTAGAPSPSTTQTRLRGFQVQEDAAPAATDEPSPHQRNWIAASISLSGAVEIQLGTGAYHVVQPA